jgi:hypothetical protein
MYEYELESLPELEGEYEGEWEGEVEAEFETEEFFGRLAALARRGVGWAQGQWRALQTPGTAQRRAALGAAHAVAQRGLPALGLGIGGLIGGVAGSGAGGVGAAPGAAIGGGIGSLLGSTVGGALDPLIPERLFESEWEYEMEGELSPIRRVYTDALMEHLRAEGPYPGGS